MHVCNCKACGPNMTSITAVSTSLALSCEYGIKERIVYSIKRLTMIPRPLYVGAGRTVALLLASGIALGSLLQVSNSF